MQCHGYGHDLVGGDHDSACFAAETAPGDMLVTAALGIEQVEDEFVGDRLYFEFGY